MSTNSSSPPSKVAQPGVKKPRKRTTFTVEQLYMLEHYFSKNQYVCAEQRTRLSVMLGLDETQIKIWFQNRRIRWRRDSNKT